MMFFFRITLKVSCTMHFSLFPMDKQSCPLLIESCEYNYFSCYSSSKASSPLHLFFVFFFLISLRPFLSSVSNSMFHTERETCSKKSLKCLLNLSNKSHSLDEQYFEMMEEGGKTFVFQLFVQSMFPPPSTCNLGLDLLRNYIVRW